MMTQIHLHTLCFTAFHPGLLTSPLDNWQGRVLAGTTGTSTISPSISSNPSSTAQVRQCEISAVPPQWFSVLLASSVVQPPSPPPSPSPPPPTELWSAELAATEKRPAAQLEAIEARRSLRTTTAPSPKDCTALNEKKTCRKKDRKKVVNCLLYTSPSPRD